MPGNAAVTASIADDQDDGIPIGVLWAAFIARWKLVLGGAVLIGALAYGATYLIKPTYTAKASFLPPQQQSSASSALASLGALGALAGLSGGMGSKTTADQYVAFMQSNRVVDAVIDKFDLIKIYESKFRVDARKELLNNAKILVGKKDGLISVSVDDEDPRRAADLANAFIDGLRGITNTLAVSEAQQRRAFFQQQLEQSKVNLTQAQVALQSSGFNAGAIKAEPKAAAEGFAKLKAELTGAEIKLQSLRGMLSDTSPEVVQQALVVSALRLELSRVEQKDAGRGDIEYITKYREYKYQETLFEMFAKQYELARVDESREGALIQVLDVATPPERRSKPIRSLVALGSAVFAFLAMGIWAVVRGLKEAGK
jgi:uncharacterized protein involved in exopolysaccharide biosynthesis